MSNKQQMQESRNSNIEIRNKHEGCKFQIRNRAEPVIAFPQLGFRLFGFVSDFEFRASNFDGKTDFRHRVVLRKQEYAANGSDG